MVETYVGPSELHLKKELGALCKARFLRDPETCSSWRSRLSSRSLTAAYNLKRGNAPGTKLTRTDSSQKKVYLYNWRHHSSKSSDRGLKLNDNSRQDSVDESLDDSSSILSKVDSKSDTYLEVYANAHGVRDKQPEKTATRAGRKSQRSGSSRKQIVRNSAVTKFLDGSSTSLGILNQVEGSDDSDHGHGNSEDLRQPAHEYAQGTGYPALSASPLLSLSARRNRSCSKFFGNTGREESSHSYTPISTSSYNRYGVRNASTAGSWDGTTSFDEDELDQMDLPGQQGCGIPCYWPKRSKDTGCGGWYSPSLSDTLRRKGNSILCRGQKLYNKRRLSASQKQKYLLKTSQGLSHLTSSCGGGSSSSEAATDELSSNFGELDLEAMSRLDGRRWSTCKSQDGWELALPGATNMEILHRRSLNQKHRPMSFDEIMGQNIVVQSISNAVIRGRIAPAYLFYGPRGTGKTATAMVFSAALNCLSTEHKKPCGFCKECRNFSGGNGSSMIEVDATDNESMNRFTYLLKNMSVARKSSRHKVYVIEECHMLSSKLWSAFTKFLEEPLPRVVFIFVTIDPDKLPRAILSRCQKYLFPKIKDADIVCRLRKISDEEKLDVELDALNVIALNSDGSLRDAETMLDQLSLLGKRITSSLVNDLLGIVSEERLLDLLEIAMSSDTAETVKRSRELMDSGVDPMALMNQLAALIMDIIAGTYQLANSECGGTVLGGRSLTEGELERLQQALKILSDAEKQLKVSSERSTWFTAALLQLGSGHDAQQTPAISHELSTVLMRITGRSPTPHGHRRSESFPSQLLPSKDQSTDHEMSKDLAEIWKRCIERCHSKKLRELLYDHGKLVSITESEGILVAFIGFTDDNIKSQVERLSSSIKTSLDMVLRHSVEIRIGLMSEYYTKGKSVVMLPARDQAENVKLLLKKKMNQSDELDEYSEKDRKHGASEFSRKSPDYLRSIIQRTLQKHEHSAVMNGCINKSDAIHRRNENGQVHRTLMGTTDEQRLESAWLQAEEKCTPGSLSHLKREKNQIHPQNGASLTLSSVMPRSSSCREEDLNQQIEALKACNARLTYNEETSRRVDHSAISPSLLHNNNLAANSEKENTEYDSAPGCDGLFCWNIPKSNRGKLKQGTRLRSRRSTHISLFGECGKSKTLESAATDKTS
ncbi:DNA polymerase III subunit gamma/ tau protein [Dioscorea alata]|uniref:DNA polymerase III subunit gamma/ tau protein n=1 Tax=Dioscorea alata TaxID=55571 RepID=A0ACB7VAN7_DIOAL|nr:DNA polymerase III subunit gamma/ tau protein [Dioscorea alata]